MACARPAGGGSEPVDLARDAGEVADQLDELVRPAREPENAVLTDNARVVRWAGPAFVLFSEALFARR